MEAATRLKKALMLNALVSRNGIAPPPTAFPELNQLLAGFMVDVQSILRASFVGAYLTGSFALGAGDLHSDCDFLVVTEDRVTAQQERGLREIHDEIPTRSGYWPHNLEGSYAPRAELKTLDALGVDWLYIDRGWREMQWSTHCNAEEVRWTLRERGISLAGPDPRSLVNEVPADALRSRMRRLIESFLPDLYSGTSFDIAGTQRYAVASLCRMLYTVRTGEVASKPASLEWGKQTLDPTWRDLIQQVIDDRALAWDAPPRPESVEPTIAFAGYAREIATEHFP